MAFDLIVSERSATVKPIGETVMATFETPDRAIRMREAMSNLGEGQHQNLVAGIHEGPCPAVDVSGQQD